MFAALNKIRRLIFLPGEWPRETVQKPKYGQRTTGDTLKSTGTSLLLAILVPPSFSMTAVSQTLHNCHTGEYYQ